MVYTWDLNPVAFSFAGLEVHWYGVMYLANFFLFSYFGWWLYQKYFKDRANLSWKTWENLIFGGFIAGILGGRIGFMLFYNFEALTANPLNFFKVWEGGMSIHGGVLGSILFGLWWCKHKQQSFYKMVDIFIIPLCLALVLGRLTNFINGELYGRINPAGWGVIFPAVDDAIRYPSQLFEAAKNGVMALVFASILKFSIPLKPGTWLGLFLIMYGAFRFIIEFYRQPEIYVGPLTMGQTLCTIMIVLGVSLISYLYAFKKS
jgi:phosphatidylglycerol:prolipoprotein diacylglycerol transferase